MSEFETDIDHSLQVLEQGGLILYPTDTIWGIGCDATNAEAVQKVYTLKERDAAKSMIVLVADEKDILRHVANPDPGVFDYLANIERPTTVVYDGALGLAPNLVNTDGTIAIRITSDRFCNHLIKRFRKPIVSTSANLSGDPTPGKFSDILDYIRKGVDYIVSHRQDDDTVASPSAVVRWQGNGQFSVIRE